MDSLISQPCRGGTAYVCALEFAAHECQLLQVCEQQSAFADVV